MKTKEQENLGVMRRTAFVLHILRKGIKLSQTSEDPFKS